MGRDQTLVIEGHINVLDKGYVRLVDSLGGDLSIVNAARVSFDRESLEFNEKDEKLLSFLIRENHSAPFRHGILQFECYAPLFVKNQWIKHLVGSTHSNDAPYPGLDPFFAWNESSRRYVTENEEFYIPSQWRSKPENNKQGSGTAVLKEMNDDVTCVYNKWIAEGERLYQDTMALGIAPEQARLFLPANALYVRWRWTTSLQGAMHFIALREDSHAQFEIQKYASAIRQLSATVFPKSIECLK